MPSAEDLRRAAREIPNPFEEHVPRIGEYTAKQIAILQSRLEKQLGPEYISNRTGPGGQKLCYLAAEKAIMLANEVFGFNGWSSEIRGSQVDFVDECQKSGKINLGLSTIVRVTLKDGTFHEDIGYGLINNAPNKGQAFEKAKKEATTDALKRALRNFGNVLGNCLYDKTYLANIQKVKVKPPPFEEKNLHRSTQFAPKLPPKSEPQLPTTVSISKAPRNPDDSPPEDDEFGSSTGLFDDVDMARYDDVAMDALVVKEDNKREQSHATYQHAAQTRAQQTPRTEQGSARPLPQSLNHPNVRQGQSAQTHVGGAQAKPNPPPNPQVAKTTLGDSRPNGPGRLEAKAIQAKEAAAAAARSNSPNVANGNRISTAQAGSTRSDSPANPHGNGNSNRPPGPSTRLSEVAPGHASESGTTADTTSRRADGGGDTASGENVAVGFITSRAAETMIANGQTAPGPHLPAFNPHAESPSIRRTGGFDHNKSAPVTRDGTVPGTNSNNKAPLRTNYANPMADPTRRIGAPGGAPSPLANRGSYKPPQMVGKRPADGDGRSPLVDMSNTRVTDGGLQPDPVDVKKQKV